MGIDVLLLIVAAYGFYLGFSEGIVKAIFAVMSIVLGIVASFKFAPATTRFLETALGSQNPLLFIVGFVLTFFGARFLINTSASVITEMLNWSEAGLVNKILGGTVLTFIFILSYSIMLSFATSVYLVDAKTLRESNTYEFLHDLPKDTKRVFLYITPIFTDFWRESSRIMDKIDKEGVQRTDRDSEIYDIEENANPPQKKGQPQRETR